MAAPRQILLLFGDPRLRALAARELHREFPGAQLGEIEDETALDAALHAGPPDLALTDGAVPWAPAPEALRTLSLRRPSLPVLLVADGGGDVPGVAGPREHRRVVVIRRTGGPGALGAAVRAALDRLDPRRELQHTVEALRCCEERFSKLFRSSATAVSITTLDGRFLDVNDRFLELCGYARQEILGRTTAELRTWADPQERVRTIEALRSAGVLKDLEVKYRTKSGEIRNSLFSLELIEYGGQTAILSLSHDITERRRVEEALRRSEERYRAFVTNIPGIPWTTTQEDVLAFLGPNAEKVHGFSAEEIERAGPAFWKERIHSEDYPRVMEAYRDLFATGAPYHVEFRFRRKDGTWAWLDERATTTYERDGVRYADGVTWDISDRKQTEEALRESEERYRSLVCNIPGVTWTADARGQETFVSPNEEEVSGFTAEEVYAGKEAKWSERIHPEDRVRVLAAYSALFAGQGKYDVEYRLRTKDGRWIWVHDRATGTYERDGEKYADGLTVDISARKETEESLRRSERQLLEAQQIGHVGSWEWKIASDEVAWSDETYRIFGLEPQQFAGSYEGFLERVHPADRARIQEDIDRVLRDRLPYNHEFRICRPDGAVRTIYSRGQVIVDAVGRAVRMVGIGQDITERKRVEEEMRLLLWITVAVSEADNLHAALEVVLDKVCEAAGWELGQAWVPREDGKVLEWCAASHATDPRIIGFRQHNESSTFAPRAGLLGRAWRSKRPVWIHDVRVDPNFLRAALAAEAGLIASMAVPVLARNEAVAIIEFFFSEPRQEDRHFESLVQAIAAQVGWLILRKRAEEERARLHERERQARAEAEAALARLRAIQSVTDAALANLLLDDLLGELLARIRSALGADAATVLLLTESHEHFYVRSSQGSMQKTSRPAHIPIGQGIAGRIAAGRKGIIVDDLRKAEVLPPRLRRSMRSLIGVPLLVEGEIIGVLHTGTRRPRRFTEEDLRLLQMVADRAAPAIDRARLFEEVQQGQERLRALSRRLVELQEAERRAIARELHDEIGQLLTGLKLLLESGGPRGTRQKVKALVNEILGRVRALSMNLRPAVLDDLGLVPALLWLIGRYTEQTGVKVDFRHVGVRRRLAPEVETASFRIVQEALTNVARHARVKDVKVEVRSCRRHLHLRVEDRGAGFDLASVLKGSSSGLTGMHERARLLGGRVRIQSGPDKGTRLMAELPLGSSAAMQEPAGGRRQAAKARKGARSTRAVTAPARREMPTG